MNTFAYRFRQSRSCRWRFVSRKVCDVAHAVKTRRFDSENRVAGYALTNSLGRGVTATLAYDGSRMSGMTFALPNGGTFSTALTRNAARPDLVTRRAYSANGSSIYTYQTDFDLLGRPVNATDSQLLAQSYLYNRRSELAATTIGTNAYEYAYDTIGNRTAASANSVTNTYAANALNQHTQIDASQLTYDNDGNLTQDDRFAYSYDAENRLLSVRPISPTEGALSVANRYDHKHRRIEKVVERFDGEEWQTVETHTFVYDGGNIVLEKIASPDGTSRTVEYFWGNDLSGSEQGAGGVGGLLAVSIDGMFYFPCYDQNGNVVCYVSESGTIAAQFVFDPYGNVIDQYGNMSNQFAFGFSTKYLDRETGLIGYQRRFYRPDHGRWLNRDPIEEFGGDNLYIFCGNNALYFVDSNGLSFRDDFIDSARVVSGVGTAILGASIGVAASWTGAGAVGGIALFTLGVNQALGGLDSMISRAEGGPATDNSPIQYAYRSFAQTITGKEGSDVEIFLNYSFDCVELASSCYGGYVAVRTTVSAVRIINVPARTVKTPVINNGYIKWTFELRAAYWKLRGGGTAATEAISIMFDGVSEMSHNQNLEGN